MFDKKCNTVTRNFLIKYGISLYFHSDHCCYAFTELTGKTFQKPIVFSKKFNKQENFNSVTYLYSYFCYQFYMPYGDFLTKKYKAQLQGPLRNTVVHSRWK